MREVSLYVNNIKLDLFKDEQIQVTSSIQNVQDISKVFTDFTQTFTVPCSKTNNRVFEHYYNNDVDATFSAQNRQPARLEINSAIFRTGKLQLESAEVKGSESDNYKVTFYGEITTLKDLFGKDKLSDLDYSGILEEYDEATVVNAQTDQTELDVRYPLISSNRVWEYGDSSPADISTVSGKINYTELFPALKARKVLSLIENKYNISFNGLFLSHDRFLRYFTWWKNKKTPNFTYIPTPINFETGGVKPLKDGIFYLQYATWTAPTGVEVLTKKGVTLFLTPDTTGTIWIDVYNNGEYSHSIERDVTAGVQIAQNVINNAIGSSYAEREYSWKIRSATAMSITGKLKYNVNATYINGLGVVQSQSLHSEIVDIDTVVLSNRIDFSISAPNINVSDYFTGILNAFNLTCFPISESEFQLEPLDEWYNSGDEYNITKHTDDKSIEIERIKLHKAISFEYQECKSFMNEQFTGVFGRNYGDLKQDFDYDGGEFKIKLPFENLLFNKFTGTNLQVGYSMTEPEENKSYIPKCTNLYFDKGNYPCSFYLGSSQLTSYLPFGQDLTIGGDGSYTLNFGSEQSTLKGSVIDGSLFNTYYLPYLENLYNPKSRRVRVKTTIPLSWIINLSLNAKIILRDKKYIIEEMKTNLTTGEVTFTLISDLRQGYSSYTVEDVVVTSIGGTVTTGITIPRNNQGIPTTYAEIGVPPEPQFVTTSPALPTTITESTNFEFTVPVNNTGSSRTNTIPIHYYDVHGNFKYLKYTVITQSKSFSYLTGGGQQLLTNDLEDLTT